MVGVTVTSDGEVAGGMSLLDDGPNSMSHAFGGAVWSKPCQLSLPVVPFGQAPAASSGAQFL